MNTHGGKREGAGRKSLTPGIKRVQFSVSVRPETRDKAAELRSAGIKLGQYIDQLVDDLYNGLDSERNWSESGERSERDRRENGL